MVLETLEKNVITKGMIKSGEYYDSVSLMVITKKLLEVKGILDSAIFLGTKENRKILKSAGLYLKQFDKALDNDLLISFKGINDSSIEEAFKKMEELFIEIKNKKSTNSKLEYLSIDHAKKDLPESNIALISIAGKYAYFEAMNALKRKMNVMLFSNNVSLKEEIELKKYASENNLLVMGPDCGTSIIAGVPLAFANKVSSGNIGVIGASGTGIQEVTTLISNLGGGISHALGTGGRDITKEVGGISFLSALELLEKDDSTKVILLVSKPPHLDVIKKIEKKIKLSKKKIIAVFLGVDKDFLKSSNMIFAKTLEEAALKALSFSIGRDADPGHKDIKELSKQICMKLNNNQKYIRGLFSGGTFSLESQLILESEFISDVYSNGPIVSNSKLADPHKSKKNTIIDFGAEEFTEGKPHPMIDYTLRNKRILKEASDPEVACLYIDLVLGFGSNKNPIKEFIPTIEEARRIVKEDNRELAIICTVIGTKFDLQNALEIKSRLLKNNVIVPFSNAQGAYLCANIIKNQFIEGSEKS